MKLNETDFVIVMCFAMSGRVLALGRGLQLCAAYTENDVDQFSKII